MERLTERFDEGIRVLSADDKPKEESKIIWGAIEKLADYEDAEEQGRLIDLPVAIGETLFEVCGDKYVRGTYRAWISDRR